ncbi:uncharacterized protein LOC107761873 isoform X1 [Nicotiana tabacum]|uniref:Uncharacterized protein LOC107761873 isoform X1 n=1 Tax=Nicotiana tabacum TaxID=4097 RepID=A0AC58UFE8_TOBAC
MFSSRYTASPWIPQEVPDLEDWVRKLAPTFSYAERAWRDLAKGRWEAKNHGKVLLLVSFEALFVLHSLPISFYAGVTKDAALRPSSGEEGNESPVPKSGKDKKCKAASRLEGPKPKTRRVRRKAIALLIDSVQRLREEEEGEEEEEEEGGSSALVSRSARAIDVTEAPEPMAVVPVGVDSGIPSLDRNAPSNLLGTMTVVYSPSLPTFSEEELKEARELKTPDVGKGSSAGDPFRDCFTIVGDASDIGDAFLLLEEAQRFITRVTILLYLVSLFFSEFDLCSFPTVQAISRFRVDFGQCEVELQKVSGERDALRLLCNQKDEAIKDLQADLARLVKKGPSLTSSKRLKRSGHFGRKSIKSKLNVIGGRRLSIAWLRKKRSF